MFTPFAFIKRQVSAAIAAINQRILLAGNFSTFNNPTGSNGIRLINGSSQIDTTFNVGNGANDSVYSSAFDQNGKLTIGGAFTSYSGSAVNRIVRINPSGSIDTTFNVGSGSNNLIYAVLPVSDSKTIIGGAFTSYSSSAVDYLTRINSNGTIDSTFKNPTLSSTVNALATQSDGKTIVGGGFTTSQYSTPFLAKLNSESNPDYTFDPGVGPDGAVYAFASQSDGKIIIGGAFTSYSGSAVNRIVRINPSGSIDTSFNVGTQGFNNDVNVIRVQPDGKVLVGGTFTSYSGSATQNRIIRLNTNGTIDSTFVKGTAFNNGTVYDIQLQSDGKIIAVGSFTTSYSGSSAIRIARINISGSLDTTFNSGTTGFSGIQYSIQIQNDQKIIVVGASATYSGSAAQRIRRINTNGTLDTTFNIGTTGLNNITYKAKIQPDQKIIVLGAFTSYSGSAINRIARINTNGTLDTTFNPGTGFGALTSVPSALELDSSGNIYAGSNFTTYSGSTANYYVKIVPSGSRFDSNVHGFTNTVTSILVGSEEGVAYFGGSFPGYQSSANYIIRLNTNGTKDFSFKLGTGFNNTVYDIKTQSDDKIVAAGAFTSYSGSAINRIIRLDTDGTKDTTFNPGTGPSGNAYKVALENTGKVLLLGSFSSYNQTSSAFIARANANGTLDSTFSPPQDFNTTTTFNQDILVDSLGSIHVTSPGRNYSKLTPSGSYDLNTINISSRPTSFVKDSSNNITLIGGTFSGVANTNAGIIAFDSIKNVSSSLFNPGTGSFFSPLTGFGYPQVSTKTSTGDIWLGGPFKYYSGSYSDSGIVKINQQGNVLVSVNSSTVSPISLQPQSDGKLIVGGSNNANSTNLIRLNSDGTLDNSFGNSFLGDILTIQVQSTGKVLIGGDFGVPLDDGDGGYTATNPFYFLRLNEDGTTDNSFPQDQTNGAVYNIHTLPNSSSILTGNFSTYSGSSSSCIVKINSEGVRDVSYNVGTGFDGFVYKSTVQSDGKLIAAGTFTTYSGSTVNTIARINPSGSLDTTFNPGTGFNTFNSVSSKILVDSSGSIHVAGGGFTSYNGTSISGYIKILPNGNIDTTATSGSFPLSGPSTIELLD